MAQVTTTNTCCPGCKHLAERLAGLQAKHNGLVETVAQIGLFVGFKGVATAAAEPAAKRQKLAEAKEGGKKHPIVLD